MAVGDVQYFARCLESELGEHNEAGWLEWGREVIPSLPNDPIVLLEYKGKGEARLPDDAEAITANAIKPIENIGVKHDNGKDRFDLIDPDFERAIARVLTFGAKEYGDHNFKKVKDPYDRYYAALRRHLNDWRRGEATDPKTGESHLAHVICNALFLMHFDREKAKER